MQSVPFFQVADMQTSVQFYVEGLGFTIAQKWIDEGKLRWCWLEREGAALMLQEFASEGAPARRTEGNRGAGLTLYFICDDALAIYREIRARGINASRPMVGNGMWVTELADPDGYKLAFESVTDAPEESHLSE